MTGGAPPDFAKIWLSYALTHTATKCIAIVLPLLAVVAFDAGPVQVGLVNAAQTLPLFLLTLLMGAWLDHHARRPSLVVAHLARGAVLLPAVPLLLLADSSGIWLLCTIAFAAGALTALADVAYPVYVSSSAKREHLVTANSRLELANSLTQVAAPGLGGLLVGVLGGSWTVALVAVLYVCGGVAVILVRTPENRALPTGPRRPVAREIADGARFLARTRMLRLLALEAAWFNLFEQAVVTVYLVFAVRTLDLSPTALGISMGVGAIGAVLGSGSARRLGRAVGMRRVLIGGMAAASAAPALIPMAQASPAPVVVAGASFVLYGFGLAVFNVFSVSMRQSITPPELLGRVTAAFRFVAFGTIWIGALVGGGLGGWLGTGTALWISAVALVAGWVVFALRFTALLRTDPELHARTESLVGKAG